MTRTGRKRVVIFVTAAAIIAGLWTLHWWPRRSLIFDSPRWKSAHTLQECDARFRMMNDVRKMIESGKLSSQQSARDNLGPPNSARAAHWFYDLGPEHNSLFRIDHDWLELTFDEQGNLLSHRVRPD